MASPGQLIGGLQQDGLEWAQGHVSGNFFFPLSSSSRYLDAIVGRAVELDGRCSVFSHEMETMNTKRWTFWCKIITKLSSRRVPLMEVAAQTPGPGQPRLFRCRCRWGRSSVGCVQVQRPAWNTAAPLPQFLSGSPWAPGSEGFPPLQVPSPKLRWVGEWMRMCTLLAPGGNEIK